MYEYIDKITQIYIKVDNFRTEIRSITKHMNNILVELIKINNSFFFNSLDVL